MRILDTKEIANCVCRLALRAGRRLSEDCVNALTFARNRERGASEFALSTLLENAETASRLQLPVCQDTGMSVVLLRIGQEVLLCGAPLQDAVDDGVRRAYAEGYFRKSICDPLTRANTGDNTPAALHTEIVPGDQIQIDYLPKGFGSENMSRLVMLTPAEGRAGVLSTIVETVRLAGSRPCPPVFVGVGIGGSFDGCALLAKKALLREIGSRHAREDVASIEREALEAINNLHIGAQGFGGTVTAIGVACEIAPTHIAGLPVAVNIQCHCVRREREVI